MDKFCKNCDCEKWKKNCELLDSAIMLAITHGMKGLHNSFEYCPWCGKFLEQEKAE